MDKEKRTEIKDKNIQDITEKIRDRGNLLLIIKKRHQEEVVRFEEELEELQLKLEAFEKLK